MFEGYQRYISPAAQVLGWSAVAYYALGWAEAWWRKGVRRPEFPDMGAAVTGLDDHQTNLYVVQSPLIKGIPLQYYIAKTAGHAAKMFSHEFAAPENSIMVSVVTDKNGKPADVTNDVEVGPIEIRARQYWHDDLFWTAEHGAEVPSMGARVYDFCDIHGALTAGPCPRCG